MPKGRITSLHVSLTPAERHTLETWQWRETIPAGRARRGRLLLLLADGVPVTRVAALVGISRRFVYKWVQRFQAQGLAGLADLPRPGPTHRRRWAADHDDPAPCPYCGEPGGERSCTGAMLADDDGTGHGSGSGGGNGCGDGDGSGYGCGTGYGNGNV